MPLSEQEQRLLEEMERSLYHNDADFVAGASGRHGRPTYSRVVLGVLVGVVGVGTLIAGVGVRFPIVGVIGFIFMFAGVLIALYVLFEAPISGMSMNPARTLGSALPSHIFNSLWIYFTAPPLGMWAAAEAYRSVKGRAICAKLVHGQGRRCIFCEVSHA